MRDSEYFLTFSILLAIQILLGNFLNLPQYIAMSILPAMILCLPTRHGTTFALLTAFVAGFLADFLGYGILGLTTISLLPVALLRKPILKLCFESEIVSKMEEISIKRMGLGKLLLCATIGIALYLAIFVWIDSAGTRSLSFNLLRFFISLVADIILSALTIAIFSSVADKR